MKKILMFIGIGILCTAAFGLFILGLQYLWNWVVPGIFGWSLINYWQALGLFVLSKILFKGFVFNGGHRGGWGSYRWKKKWETMSPEDRERFKQKMREKCGWGKSVDQGQ